MREEIDAGDGVDHRFAVEIGCDGNGKRLDPGAVLHVKGIIEFDTPEIVDTVIERVDKPSRLCLKLDSKNDETPTERETDYDKPVSLRQKPCPQPGFQPLESVLLSSAIF
nr:hypothetical protein [Halegenticoccus tardaugens]